MKDLVHLEGYLKTQKRQNRKNYLIQLIGGVFFWLVIFGLYTYVSTMDYQMYVLTK